MDVLVKAIQEHAQPRPYDWMLLAFTIISIICSCWAIISALKSANFANRVALFETRCKSIENISTIANIKNEFFTEEFNDSDDVFEKTLNILESIFITENLLIIIQQLKSVKVNIEHKLPLLFTKLDSEMLQINADNLDKIIKFLQKYYYKNECDTEYFLDILQVWFKDSVKLIDVLDHEMKRQTDVSKYPKAKMFFKSFSNFAKRQVQQLLQYFKKFAKGTIPSHTERQSKQTT